MARVNPFFKSPLNLINNPLRNGSPLNLINNPIRNGGAPSFPPSNPKAEPKVVSIPVRFVGSETNREKKIDPSIAAIKIQGAFRGFLVRKNAKIVREIEAEVDEIEKKLGADGEMDLIVGDAKERLKINEMLMRLLFRLDSVRGVREYRKRVIRRVILIQEMLDSISAVESGDGNRPEGRSKNETLEASKSEKPDVEMADSNWTVGSDDGILATGDQMVESKEELKVGGQIGEAETLGNEKPGQDMVDSTSSVKEKKLKLGAESGEAATVERKSDQAMVDCMLTCESVDQNLVPGYDDLDMRESKADGAIKVTETLENKPDQEMADSVSTVDSPDQGLELADSMEIPQDLKTEVQNAEKKTREHNNQELKAEDLKPENEDQILTDWELLETNDVNDLSPVNQEALAAEEEVEEDENKKMAMKEWGNEKLKEVMERMVVENAKLKGLVAELCQRSVQQCGLMGGLAERVEHLEKTVQKMEKKSKKKRKVNASLPTSTVDKKGGNRTS